MSAAAKHPAAPKSETVESVLRRKLIFVSGKGGVGKTLVSQAIAVALSLKEAARPRRVLWVTFEDPAYPAGELRKLGPTLWHLNCEATTAFEEYAAMKIGIASLTRIFLNNALMRYLSKAAPGIHELVLLGKVWYDRLHYDQVVVDMPSTGYGLAMFQSTENFARLFKGGPIHRDAEAMLDSFRDPGETGQLIVALPEEMPLRESLELHEFLLRLFPGNPPAFLVNRRFPGCHLETTGNPDQWPSPVAKSAVDYARKRSELEEYNLRLWRDERIPYGELPFVPPPAREPVPTIVSALAGQLEERSYL